jgi:hypothetical protein
VVGVGWSSETGVDVNKKMGEQAVRVVLEEGDGFARQVYKTVCLVSCSMILALGGRYSRRGSFDMRIPRPSLCSRGGAGGQARQQIT